MKNIFIYALIIGIIFASTPLEEIKSNWQTLAAIGIIISSLISVLVLYLGKIFKNEYIEMTFKMELVEIVLNLIIIVLITLLFSLSNAYFNVIDSCSSSNCMYELANKTLNDLKNRSLEMTSKTLSDAVTKNAWGTLSSLNVKMNALPYIVVDFSLNYLYEISKVEVMNRINLLKLSLYPLLGISTYLNYYAMPLGLLAITLGVFLRSFMFTRRAGATLIGVGIGSAYILPLLIILFMGGVSISGTSPGGICPNACKSQPPIGFTNNGESFSYDQLISMGVNESSIKALSKGDIESITIEAVRKSNINPGSGQPPQGHNVIIIHSCKYYALLKDNPSLKDDILNGEDENNAYWQCSDICRMIPYPDDIPMCRDGETACKRLYDISKGACFKYMNMDKDTFAKFLKSNITYEGREEEIGYAMGDAKCFSIKPSRIPTKNNVNEYCPTKCRYYLYNGNELKKPCENKYDCNTIYSKNGVNKADIESIANLLKQRKYAEALEKWNESSISLMVKYNGDCNKLHSVLEEQLEIPYSVDCSGCESAPTQSLDSIDDTIADILVRGYIGGGITLASLFILMAAISNSLGGEVFIPAVSKLL